MTSGATPAWWLDELAHAGPEHLDADYVSTYTAKAGFDPTDDIDALVALGLDGESTVVDLGAGTGAFTVAAAAVAGRVVAVDVSPPMVATLHATVDALELDNVTVVSAGLLSYRHDGAPPGFVFTRNVLHQVPDFWKAVALARIHGLLAPGGVLRLRDLVYDFEPGDAATVDRSVVRRCRRRCGPGLDGRRVGRTRPHRAQHVHVAARADARPRRLRGDRPRDGPRCLRRVHVPPPLSGVAALRSRRWVGAPFQAPEA